MPLNIPNLLTLLRIALIPVFVVVFYLPYSWSNEVTTLIFALAGLTDWLDGYLARRLKQESPFGAFLDPVADKLIVAAALVLLVQAHPTPLLAIPALIIIGREIAISALREWMAAIGERVKVAVMMVGKLKTSAQIGAILLLLYGDSIGPFPTYDAGIVLIYVAAALTLWSMIVYLIKAWPILQGKSS
ncbi:CDP-diacylglycerol--glycerol-3-phosphate 3-phosphatidyltransferase [Solemya pervernicosa gill symbiont]|uniref:CDP-diacylglycerol--glycerol-3-phosphate 3-phosphatidyltransferase n=1 Tax=Solemya pervernicosa gill symbiont TaxID=642797 RepID=A0A1T2L0A6_9GAMM|nr:CDP-diacylglycerol--glycerol-3-phosphate 3-phosphatidyltransferase [Solemya pervernicosa gill symbiont]OOZ38511.1 CDP-diacylglycerol--glycerol-3-phosphate 3-phosphatidyltransferase [Solemya pervernicosa gill symbiont]